MNHFWRLYLIGLSLVSFYIAITAVATDLPIWKGFAFSYWILIGVSAIMDSKEYKNDPK